MIFRRATQAVLCLALLFAAHLSLAAQQPQPALRSAPLDALAGEYTNPSEPDTPLSFYVANGKLTFESERFVPTDLKQLSATEFAWSGAPFRVRFTLDEAGRAASFVFSNSPDEVFLRTGPPAHHIFHDYGAAKR